VYDQDNRNLHLAQAANCGTELVAISQGRNAVPSIVGGCSTASIGSMTASTPTAVTTSEAPTSTRTTPSSTTTPGSENTTFPSSHSITDPTATTFIVTSTEIYSVTSCPPTVTDCPYGRLTTDVAILTTTLHPGPTDDPSSTLSISAPCLNCDVPSSSPTIIGTGSYVPTGSVVLTETWTATSRPTAVVTAGAPRAASMVKLSCLTLGIIVAAALL